MKTNFLASLSYSTMIKTALLTAFMTSLIACIDPDSENETQAENKADIQLKEDASQAELKQFLTARFTQKASSSNYADTSYMESIAIAENALADDTASSDASESNPADFSGTNNQVAGVDEGDLWKYDGENFFVLKPAKVDYQYDEFTDCNTAEPVIFSAALTTASSPVAEQDDMMTILPCGPMSTTTPAQLRIVKNSMEELANLELESMSPSEMYLNDNSLVVLGNRNHYQNNWASAENWQDGQSHMSIIDVQTKTQPEIKHSIVLDGYVVQSRRIGDEIFLISRYSPNIPNLIHYPETDHDIAANKRLINNINLGELLPKLTINEQEFDLVSDRSCLIPQVANPNMGSISLTMITRINIDNAQFTSRCMAGDVHGIYMSTNNLYTFNTSYWNFSDSLSESLHWTSGNTHLHKFDLTSFAYQGSAVVAGQLASNNPRLRLGELKDGSIAVVTSKKSSNTDWRLTQHQLTVLKTQGNELKTIATLPNEEQPAAIGKVNEQIYSVRFMQDRAYIVTFEKVDPLYVIDLSNPSQPSIAGELEIPGFSDYLHPISNDLLLGIGKDAILGASGTTWYQGIKVSLFNVSDIQQPTELGNIQIGKRGSSTPLSYDPLSFTSIQQDGQYRFAFPIMENNGPAQGSYWGDPESQFYQWSQSGLYLFEIKDNQLTQAGALITKSSDNSDENGYHNMNTSRGLIQGDTIYHLNHSDLYKADWNQPDDMSDKF